MDPQTPQHSTNSPRWPLSKKATILLGVGLAFLLLIIIVIVAMSPKSNPQTTNDSLYVAREGYPKAEGVSDPTAVVMNNDQTTPVTYKDQAVIQACNLLSLDELKQQGLLIKANTLPTAISRTFNDGVGKSTEPYKLFGSSLSALGLGDDINSCNYVLEEESSASIGINVFQTTMVSPEIINEELADNYSPSEAIDGIEAFKQTRRAPSPGGTNSEEYIFRSGETAFYVSLQLSTEHATKTQSLLQIIVKNFKQELTQPSGVSKIAYNSAPFTKSYTPACELITNQSVKDLSGEDAAPLVREGIASATGLLAFRNFGDQTLYLYVANECTRSTMSSGSGLGSRDKVSLNVETTSFLEDKAAQHDIEMQRHAGPNNRERMESPTKVGDEAVVYTSVTGDGHLIFRKGRVVVDITINRQAFQKLGINDLQSLGQKLAPIAEDMVAKVKN